MKKIKEDKKGMLKKSYQKVIGEKARLELNYYVQKMMMEHPENYIEEIKKDIQNLEYRF